jgi:hypothetical protein
MQMRAMLQVIPSNQQRTTANYDISHACSQLQLHKQWFVNICACAKYLQRKFTSTEWNGKNRDKTTNRPRQSLQIGTVPVKPGRMVTLPVILRWGTRFDAIMHYAENLKIFVLW